MDSSRSNRLYPLSPQEWQAAWQQGHAWTPAQAVDAAERWLSSDFTA